MPESEKCPLGISLIAIGNALLSVSMLTLGVPILNSVYKAWRQLRQVDEYVVVSFALDIAIFILAFVCAAAGLDLWRLRNRGRLATIFFMSIFALMGVDIAEITLTRHSTTEDSRRRMETELCYARIATAR